MTVRRQTVIASSNAALNAGSIRAPARSPPASNTAQQNEKYNGLSVRPLRRRLEAQPRLIDKVKLYMSEPPQSRLSTPDTATAVDVTAPTGAAPTPTPTVRPPEPTEPDEPESHELRSESPEPSEAGESNEPDPNDALDYGSDRPLDSDETHRKSRDSVLRELREWRDRFAERLEQRPACEHRLPPRYRD